MTITDTNRATTMTKKKKKKKKKGVRIQFHNVGFRFAGAERDTLVDTSFSIEEGERAALVGISGSGKSTILSLLNGLEPGYTGSILIDGIELRTLTHHQLNGMMTLVTQEPFIMRRTIADNISFGANVDRTKIMSAAARASAHDFIDALPMGYYTEIAENGSTLSGGQRQRICLARALVRTPQLLLLDEPTSKLDNQSQRAVRNAIDQLTDMTIIEVAHRLNMVRKADLIIVIDKGSVRQQGTFEQLADDDGLFADLLHEEQDRH